MSMYTKVALVLSIFFVASCATPSQDWQSKTLVDYLSKHAFNAEELDAVFVMTEEGCHKCAQSYALYLSDKIEWPKTLIVVTAKGSAVDISPFLQSDKVLFDPNKNILSLGLCEGSAAIFLKNGTIDTLLEIAPIDLEKRLNYISNRIANVAPLNSK